MPKPEEWYQKPNAKEITITVPVDKDLIEQRIRQRFITKTRRQSEKKEIDKFIVGYEIEYDGEWQVVIRFCNYHEDEGIKFHVHNYMELDLPLYGDSSRIELDHKKDSGSQMRWSMRYLNNYFRYFKKQFIKIKKQE